jgi:MFS superfamily sulfate permease-like transporter
MTVGVLPGVLIAVGLALLKLLRVVSHPRDAVLGLLDRSDGEYCVTEEEGGKTFPELIIYRFESPLLFFIADYFSDRVRTLIRNAETPPQSFLFGAEAVPLLDISGAFTLDSLRAELADKGILLAIARARGWFRVMLDRAGVTEKIGKENLFPTVHAGVRILRGNSDTISAKQPITESVNLCVCVSVVLFCFIVIHA